MSASAQLPKERCAWTLSHILGELFQSLEHSVIVAARRELRKHVEVVARVLTHEGGVAGEVAVALARRAAQLQAADGERRGHRP